MTHTFNLDKTSIRLVVSHGGKKWRKATGLTTEPKLWNKNGQSLRARCTDRRVLDHLRLIDARLREKEDMSMTDEEVEAAIEYALTGVNIEKPSTPARPTFWEYFDSWAERESTSKRQRKLARDKVAAIMGRREDWEAIDSAYFFRLQKGLEGIGASVNYQWNVISRLKSVMSEGRRLKYHTSTDYADVRVAKEPTEAIALTKAEIDLLWKYKTKSKLKAKVRDLALVGYYTASRFSDYSRLSLDNIRDGVVEFYQQKTGDKVVLPASPKLIEILERNGGEAPAVHQVVFNRYIKMVAKEAGIGGVVDLPKSRRKPDGKPTYRWEMVQSHTFRRSAITELYLSGVPAKDCMFLSGHKSLRAFETYVRTSKEQAAVRMKDNPFFK